LLGPTVTGNGNITEQQRSVDSFEKVKVKRGLNVFITQGESEKLMVRADENLLEYIETDVEDNTLTITTSANIRNPKSLKVFVTITDISEINATAGSNVDSEEMISCSDLAVS